MCPGVASATSICVIGDSFGTSFLIDYSARWFMCGLFTFLSKASTFLARGSTTEKTAGSETRLTF